MNIALINNINNLNIEKKSYGLVNLLSGNKKEEVSKDDGVGGLLLELQKERIKTEEIAKKIVRGEAVNSEDLQYIKDKNPSLLDKASEFKNERKVLEGKIRSAKSRKEAIDILNKDIMISVTAFLQDVITESPEAVKNFYAAYDRAIEYLNNNDISEYEDIVISTVGYSEDMRGNIELSEFTTSYLPDEEKVQKVLDWSKESGIITADLKAKDVMSDIAVK